jgi:hypothetical protein
MAKEKIDLDIEFAKLGGNKVGEWRPSGTLVDSSDIPGVRCVMPPPSRVEAKSNPAESVEKEDDARE